MKIAKRLVFFKFFFTETDLWFWFFQPFTKILSDHENVQFLKGKYHLWGVKAKNVRLRRAKPNQKVLKVINSLVSIQKFSFFYRCFSFFLSIFKIAKRFCLFLPIFLSILRAEKFSFFYRFYKSFKKPLGPSAPSATNKSTEFLRFYPALVSDWR